MIAEALRLRQAPAWRRALREAVTRPAELLEMLALTPADVALSAAAAGAFRLRVPRGFVRRMRRGDAADPLLRQVLPAAAELRPVPGFVADPVADLAAERAPGLLCKYTGRALLVLTGACAVHCRYCFRRHFPYAGHRAAAGALEAALAAIGADPGIEEVILSGGDPLLLDDPPLAALAARLAAIGHVRRLRIHTRVPIVLPERVDDALLAWVARGALPVVVVVHANHANEIDAAVIDALGRLRGAGVTLLNQAVLLRGVNDSATALAALSEAVFAAGALPYYLHALDPVAGAAHFAVPDAEAHRLLEALRARLPGYLVPRLVREDPGAPCKRPL